MSSAKITPKIPAKPGKSTVYIDVDDEITSIIEKVEAAKEKVVALVLPKRSTVLQSIVNMRLLKHNAAKVGKNVVLITTEDVLLPLAGAAGLHVAKNLQSKPAVPPAPNGSIPQPTGMEDLSDDDTVSDNLDDEKDLPTKLDYSRAVGDLAAVPIDDEPAIALDDEDIKDEVVPEPTVVKPPKDKDKKPKIPDFDKFRILLFGGIALFIGLIVFVIFAITVLPKATITVHTQSTPVNATLTLNASDSIKTLDEKANNIPALVKTINQTQTQSATATGQQNNGTKAAGTVTLSNCTNSPATIPAGTGVSGSGLTYITQKDISLDSGNFTSGGVCKTVGSHIGSVSVLAQSGGAKYNTPASTYAVAGFSGVSGSNLQIATQGTDNNITVVSQTDVNSAAAKLAGADNTAFTKKFEDSLSSQGLYVLTSTLKAGDPATVASPAVGQQASSTTVTTTITYTVMAIQKSDLTQAITDALTKQISPTKQKLSVTNVLNSASVSVLTQSAPNVATLSVSESTTAIPTLDANSIKKMATGQKVGDIKSAIGGLPGVKSVDVNLSPFWVSKAPKVNKITVKLLQVSNG